MKGVITAPKGIIIGAFNIRFDFIRPIVLTAADITVETLAGDALGHTKDSFGGSGANYHILCYIPDARLGRSRISVNKADLEVEPIEIEYDTIKVVRPTWGTPIQRGSKVELPVTFDVAIENLKKRNFQFSQASPFQLYGSGDTYSLVFSRRTGLIITISGGIRKVNGVLASIVETVFEV